MKKEQHGSREPLKKTAMSLKEKRAAKKARKESRPLFLASEKRQLP